MDANIVLVGFGFVRSRLARWLICSLLKKESKPGEESVVTITSQWARVTRVVNGRKAPYVIVRSTNRDVLGYLGGKIFWVLQGRWFLFWVQIDVETQILEEAICSTKIGATTSKRSS